MRQPRANAPDRPLPRPAPFVEHARAQNALGGQERDVLEQLVHHAREDLGPCHGAQDGIVGRRPEGAGPPFPQVDEAEEAEGCAGFGGEVRQGQESGGLAGSSGGAGWWLEA